MLEKWEIEWKMNQFKQLEMKIDCKKRVPDAKISKREEIILELDTFSSHVSFWRLEPPTCQRYCSSTIKHEL